MKKETIKKRLERANVNKCAASYKMLVDWLNTEGNNVIRPCWTSGRGRYTTNLDYTVHLVELLTAMRVRHIVGNDAPKGGKCGNYVKIVL